MFNRIKVKYCTFESLDYYEKINLKFEQVAQRYGQPLPKKQNLDPRI